MSKARVNVWLGICLSLLSNLALAQTTYSFLLDRDGDVGTGCTYSWNGGSAVGIEVVISAQMDDPPLAVASVARSECVSGSFNSPQISAAGQPVGFDLGLAGADAIEFDTALTGLVGNASAYFVATGAVGANSVGPVTVQGLIVSETRPEVIPGAGVLALAALAVLMLWRIRRHPALFSLSGVALLVTAGVVWAANFVSDGLIADWAGVPALSTDAIGDSAEPATDLTQVFAATENGRLYLRFDVVDVESTAPQFTSAASTTFEVGAAASFAVTTVATPTVTSITRSGDPLPNGIAFVDNGDGSATLSGTPAAGTGGIHTFDFTASNGQSPDGAQTFELGINEAPGLTGSATASFAQGSASNYQPNVSGYPVPTLAIDCTPTLPASLQIDPSTGAVSGTPLSGESGNYACVLTAANGIGSDATLNLALSIADVNDAPTFAATSPAQVDEDAGAISLPGWAVFSPGGSDESGQVALQYTVSAISNPALFAVAPAVDASGALSYTPADDAFGTSSFDLRVQDDGGTANGGSDTSAAQTFVIDVRSINDAPVQAVPAGPLGTGVDVSLTIAGVSLADVDAGTGNLTVTLSASAGGTLAAASAGTTQVTGSGTSTLALSGSLADVNATLASLAFRSASPGTSTVTVSSSDNGNSGAGGVLSDGPDSFDVNVDNAPAVQSVSPADATANVALNSNIVVTFDEPVAVSGNWATLTCTSSGSFSVGGGSLQVSDADPVYTLDPNADLASGESCTLTVVAAQVADDDAVDPPDAMASDFTSTFSTTDVAPTYTGGTTPGVLANNASVTINFSEAVDIAAGGIVWPCATGGFTPALPQNGVTTITLTPSSLLSDAVSCDVTLESTLITDSDAVDPPNQLDGDGSADVSDGDADDRVLAFTVDAAPAFVSSVPANAAGNVAPSSNIVVTFSEPVVVLASSFSVQCPGGSDVAFAVSGSGTDTVTINPNADLPAATQCVVTGVTAQISDVDSIDPPDNPAAFSFSFTTGAVANADAVTVTPHLTYSSQASVLANDVLGGATLTGFGATLATANGTVPNGSNAITAGGSGGRVVLSATGNFVFYPDAGDDATATSTFFYALSNGAAGQVTLDFADDELVWFVDASPIGAVCTGDNVGTQACPATLPTGLALTADDTLFVDAGTYDHVGLLTLPDGARLVGDGSGSNLAAISGVTPVTGSTLPAFGAGTTTLTAGLDCVVLGQNNTIRGLVIGDCGGPTGAAADIKGSNFGTLSVAELTLSGTGRALDLSTGNVSGAITSTTVTAALTGAGISLNGVAGTLAFGNTAISGVERGILGLDSTASLTWGDTSVTASIIGVSLGSISNAGTYVFDDLDITTTAGIGLQVNGVQAVSVDVDGNDSPTIAATGGSAIVILDTAAFDLKFAAVTSVGTTSGSGIRLGNVPLNATFDVTGTTTITTPSDYGILIDGTAPSSTLAFGDVSINSRAKEGIYISDHKGTLSFKDVDIPNQLGVVGNAVTVTTSGGGALSSGDIAVTSLDISGTVLSLAHLDADADGIADTDGHNGHAVKLIDHTGTFSVTGIGAQGNGGTIQNIAGDGFSLVRSGGLDLNLMTIDNIGTSNQAAATVDNAGIWANNLVGSNRIRNSTISRFKDGGTSGTSNGIQVHNQGVDFTNLQVIDTTFFNDSAVSLQGDDAIELVTSGTVNGALTVGSATNLGNVNNRSEFYQLSGHAVQVTQFGGGNLAVSIADTTFRDAVTLGGFGGIDIASGGSGILSSTIDESKFLSLYPGGVNNSGVVTLFASGTVDFDATVTNSVFGSATQRTSDGRGAIRAATDTDPAATVTDFDITISNNVIDDTDREAISILPRGPAVPLASGRAMDISITNNSIGQTVPVANDAGLGREGIEFVSSDDAKLINLLVRNNAITNFVDSSSDETLDIKVNSSTSMNATIDGNSFSQSGSTGTADSLEVSLNSTGTLCLDLNSANTSANVGPNGFVLTETAGTFSIEDIGGSAIPAVTVDAFVEARNTATATVTGTFDSCNAH